ncbi:MAG: hypothetical protein WBA51_19060 [Erythrobacter sp.]
MDAETVELAEAELIRSLVDAGRRVAALDGLHLFGWGLFASIMLALQYFAEVGDWLPSNVLWLWQPVALAGFVLTMFVLRRGAGRRLGNPVSRAYATAFCAAGAGLGVFMLASTGAGLPDGRAAAMLLGAAMGSAFFVLTLIARLSWMVWPALGWWGVLGFYSAQGAIIPLDWLRLAVACAIFLALPGAVLMREARA